MMEKLSAVPLWIYFTGLMVIAAMLASRIAATLRRRKSHKRRAESRTKNIAHYKSWRTVYAARRNKRLTYKDPFE